MRNRTTDWRSWSFLVLVVAVGDWTRVAIVLASPPWCCYCGQQLLALRGGSSDSSNSSSEPKPKVSRRWFGDSKEKEGNKTKVDSDPSTKQEDKDDPTQNEDNPTHSQRKEEKPRFRALFGSRKKNQTKEYSSNDKKNETKPMKTNDSQNWNESKTDSIPSSNEIPDTNKTTTDPEMLPPNLIFFGPPPSSPGFRVIRTTLPQPPPNNNNNNVMTMRPTPDRGLLIAEAVFRLATRIWWITWLTRHFTEAETIRPIQRFVWERLNDRYTKDASVLKTVLRDPPFGVSRSRWRLLRNWKVLQRYETPKNLKISLEETFHRTVVVVPLTTNSESNLDLVFLADVVSFLLQQFRARIFGVAKSNGHPLPLEVVLLVSSPGGSVSHYGLAAAQVRRLAQEDGITLTVCVDQAAASGGYMVASQAHKLIAAPFAALGSVGVILEGLNFRELARNYGVQPIILKSGKSKNAISTFGTITPADEKQETERLERVHKAFQDLVIASRPALSNRQDILDGQIFLGSEALELKLIDQVMTSDEYIMERIWAGDRVLKLHLSSSSKHQRRFVQLSPLDLLPHLRSWISDRAVLAKLPSMLYNAGPILGFAAHILHRWMASRVPPS